MTELAFLDLVRLREEANMADKNSDYVMAGLRDAHAMEAGTVENLKRLIGRTGDYPELKVKLEEHRAVSERQRDEIEGHLKSLGSDPSTIKDVGMKIAGQMEVIGTQFASDAVPKDCMAAHGFENFEIAAYESLRSAADVAGLDEVTSMCGRFIEEERSMASFLLDHIGDVTRQYLERCEG